MGRCESSGGVSVDGGIFLNFFLLVYKLEIAVLPSAPTLIYVYNVVRGGQFR